MLSRVLFLTLALVACAWADDAAAADADASSAAVAVVDAPAADATPTPGRIARFGKKLDEERVNKDWADYEDEEWHEDTFEWKRKMAAKNQVPFDLDALQREGPSGIAKIKDTMLASEATSGNTQMAFLTLRDGVAADDEERAKLAGRWAALLGTNAVKISYHMIGGNELLITEEQGRIIEVKDFVLQQPEVLKFRWKDTDFTPTPTPTPSPKAKKGKKKAKEEL